ncbi:glycosyltransferase family 2 protein [Thalassolituus sp.]|uniref:glycosyltransferase family 2 protein n=1 Tax=Thalassolituus sp. TaxID=2030822 RepID=UPI00351627B6
MATAIVPAHNESSVIRRCLDSLISQESLDTIIVACNGCSDDTVAIVRSEYPSVICLDIDKPSKVNALNEAEKHINSWPVFYIDADIAISDGAVKCISDGMQENNLLLAAPEPVIDTSKSPWLVRRFYDAWLRLPYIRQGVIATCTFVISEEGRKRFGEFPDVIADDGYVRSHFYDHELGNIAGAQVFVSAPRTVKSLIKIKTRARLGNVELKARNLGYDKPEPDYGSILPSLLFSRHWLSAIVYIGFVAIFRGRAKQQFKNLDNYQWEVDHTSR